MNTEDKSMDYLLKSKLLNPSVSLTQLLEISRKLDEFDDGTEVQGLKWKFIIKGKFIFSYEDDSAKIQD